MAAAAKRIARVSAHKLIMRGRGEIIGKVGRRNFAHVFSGLGWFSANVVLTSDKRGLTSINPGRHPTTHFSERIKSRRFLHSTPKATQASGM